MARMARIPRIFQPRFYWPGPTDAYWRHAEMIAPDIVDSNLHKLVSRPVGPVRLVNLRVEPGYGVVYYMTIEVTGENGINTSYDAKVYRLPSGLPYEIASFDEERKTESHVSAGNNVADEKASSSRKEEMQAALSDLKSSSIITRSRKTSDEKASSSRKEEMQAAHSDVSSIITRSGKTSDEKSSSPKSGKKRASHSTMSDDNEGSTELLSEVRGRLRTRGFYILLEHIRSERPTLSYAKARKMASSKWRKLPYDEKMTFIGEAAEKADAVRC